MTDTYFLDYLAQAEQTRTDLQDALDALADGCNELTDGMDELVSYNADLNDAADTLFDAMTAQVQSSLAEAGMVLMVSVLSAVIFLVVLYLMVKVMVDRSAYSISLMKIFGYRTSEVRRLYLDGNFIVVALGALVCIPAAKAVMDAIYPNFIANVAIGMELSFSPLTYLGIYIAVLACYLLVEVLLVRRLNKMTPAEVLKNRE